MGFVLLISPVLCSPWSIYLFAPCYPPLDFLQLSINVCSALLSHKSSVCVIAQTSEAQASSHSLMHRYWQSRTTACRNRLHPYQLSQHAVLGGQAKLTQIE